ncbi:MAG: hypothetical protein N0E58_22095 [Candidatus Thiodiazotropha endolucinida]|uniref:Uncharacterized protein n=2 Tax=Candidatus Thiodiazotropha TaxID=1913444 RepID=A0A7Z0VI08_9GAMM|nr:hypothetical protein [Candidatus Thiodiazotropha endolucinida]ODJ85953.1 hypothetical protein CODIS_38490 [Candidatus Thiodiazotropha endolucinida]
MADWLHDKCPLSPHLEYLYYNTEQEPSTDRCSMYHFAQPSISQMLIDLLLQACASIYFSAAAVVAMPVHDGGNSSNETMAYFCIANTIVVDVYSPADGTVSSLQYMGNYKKR